MGTWTPKFTFTLNALALDRLDRLEAMLRDSQEESQALRAELNTLSQLVERNADRIGDIKQIHGDPALLGEHGWAFCNGTTPAEQGIDGAMRDGPTPDLTGGAFVKGGPVANLGLTTEATYFQRVPRRWQLHARRRDYSHRRNNRHEGRSAPFRWQVGRLKPRWNGAQVPIRPARAAAQELLGGVRHQSEIRSRKARVVPHLSCTL
jgi:hypothetical protein